MKKVLHLLNTNRFSGAENVVCQIIEMFKNESDYEMLYCSKDGEIRSALEERDIPFVALKELSVRELKRVINEYNPDIIHAHDMKATFVASRACGNRILISHIHNNAYDSRGVSLKSIAYLWAAKKVKHIFWVSDSSYQGYCFKSLLRKKSEVLYNVINIDKLYEKAQKDLGEYNYDVIYLGRFSYAKNPQRMISVCKKIVNKKPDAKIAIVGTGELEEDVKSLAKSLQLDSNLTFFGFCPNPLKILQGAKVMIMTSRWEGTPMCALESMALGVPIVSTPVDGLKKLIKNGESGYLSDDDEKIVNEIVRLITDDDLRSAYSSACKEISTKLNDINLYKTVLKNQYE